MLGTEMCGHLIELFSQNPHSLLGTITILGGAGLAYWVTHNHYDIDQEAIEMKRKVEKWMYNDLINKMILWKKKNPEESHNFLKFIEMEFPENIKKKGDTIIWVDPRVQGKTWRGTFVKLKASDRIRIQSDPPGINI